MKNKSKVADSIIKIGDSKWLNILMFAIATSMLTIWAIENKFNLKLMGIDISNDFGFVLLYIFIAIMSLITIASDE